MNLQRTRVEGYGAMSVVANHFLKYCTVILLVLGIGTQVCAQETANSLESDALRRLKGVGLSLEQVDKVMRLATTYDPRIQKAQKASAKTDQQRAERAAVIQKAIADGKKGKDFNKAIAGAGELTKQQQQAQQEAANLRGEFDRAVINVLTEEQRKNLAEAKAEVYSGFIIVRLSPDYPLASDDSKTLADAATELKLQGLAGVLKELELTVTGRLIRSLDVQKIVELERQAEKSKLPPRASLASYWRIDARKNDDNVDVAVERLNALPEVDLAYREFNVTDPVVNPADDDYNDTQDYQDAAPVGIDARWAWTQSNGEGASVGFVDLEQGWFPNHEDFVNKTPVIIYGDNRDGEGTYKGNHGTAVLGEVIADDNTVGVVGIAPTVDYVSMTSHYDDATGTALHVADAILGALPAMNVGDVLLLEVQRGTGLPTEVDEADFEAIRLAVASGIIVVEAAGNGNNDLDTYTDSSGDNILNRGSADFRDSGAIICGAANSALPHDRAGFSTFGSRVDCYGWGNNVTTCGYGTLDDGGGDDDKTYANAFNGTSSASPIVSGAAIILQGMYKTNFGTAISPTQMRALLSDPATGTAQGGGVAGNIGVMPNLRAIVENTLDGPNLYVRDNVSDAGEVPETGAISASPDIIVRPVAVVDPQAAFGEGSGTENNNTLGYEVEAGQDNFVYVRMANRGGQNANSVTAQVYWSPAATLVTPDMWTPVGATAPVNVPVGDTLAVTNPITWAKADLPGPGHYCFVGVLDHPSDPAPPLPGPTNWTGFQNLVRNQNNVTWRNFNVVDLDPSSEPSPMAFLIVGAPDEARVFDLEIIRRFRKGKVALVSLEVPLEFGQQLVRGRKLVFAEDKQKNVMRIEIPDKKNLCFDKIKLEQGARHQARFYVKDFADVARPGDELVMRQLYEQEELGRVIWHFAKRKPLQQ